MTPNQYHKKKALTIKPFPFGEEWRAMFLSNSQAWSMNPHYSSNWHDDSGPRKVTYATGKDKGGYRSGMEGKYRVLDIIKTSTGYRVVFFSPIYGMQDDTYNSRVDIQRTGAGFKVGTWPVSAEQAYRAIHWQLQTGLLDYNVNV